MNDRQKDWIIFLGVCPDRYNEAVAVVKFWREYARAYGVDRNKLTELNERLFKLGKPLPGHSCCLSYRSMRVDGYGTIVADFIAGGRLSGLPELFEKAGQEIPGDNWRYMLVSQSVSFFYQTEYFYILGFTLDGRIVIDTKEMYGSVEGQDEYRRTAGDREYCLGLLDTVGKNIRRLRLPEVPKGILKLPDGL